MAIKIRNNKILSRISIMSSMMMFYYVTAITARTCSTFCSSSVQLMHHVSALLPLSSSSPSLSLRIMNAQHPRDSNSYSTIRSSRRMISDNKDINNDKNNNNNDIHITLETSASSSSDSNFIESSSSESESDPDSIIITTSKTIVANNGEILRTAMLRNGISPHNGRSRLINCRGLGTCGTCAIEIYNTNNTGDCDTNNNIEPKERNTKEKLRLNFPPHNLSQNQSPNLRLACQVQVQVNGEDDGSEITVKKRKGFWGQGTMKQKEDDDSSIIIQKQQQQQQQQQQQDGVVVADDDDYKGFDKAELWFGELEYILDNKSPPPSPPSPPSSRSRSSSTLSSSSSNSYNNSS